MNTGVCWHWVSPFAGSLETGMEGFRTTGQCTGLTESALFPTDLHNFVFSCLTPFSYLIDVNLLVQL